MGNVGKKDKGNKEQRKKPKLNIKEKRKQKNEKKNKSTPGPPQYFSFGEGICCIGQTNR
jgi:hypothetical protein